VPCGVSNLQKFDLSEFIKEDSLSGPIKPANSTELCVVHRNGPSAVIDAEPILLKDCEGLGNSIRTAGWAANFTMLMELSFVQAESRALVYNGGFKLR
jgi:hypothetical protein